MSWCPRGPELVRLWPAAMSIWLKLRKIGAGQRSTSVSEVRRAPYVHDQHNPDHGVRSAFSRCVVTTADGVIRTTTMGGGRRRRLGVRRRCEAASYAIAQPRPIASSAVAASREGTHDQVLVRSRQANGSAPRAERGGTRTRPSPLLTVTNVPLMLARLIARSVVALGDGFAVSRKGASVGICAPTSACPLEKVIDCSPRALVGPGAVGR